MFRYTGKGTHCETSLEALETSVDSTSKRRRNDREDVVRFGNAFESMHNKYKFARGKLLKVLKNDNDKTLQRLHNRIADCASFPVLYADMEGQLSVGSSFCKARMCPLCADRRARELERRVHGVVVGWAELRHLTLTPKSTSSGLKESLDKLVKDFRNLRQRSIWKQYVRGGVATFEVTYNAKTEQWHPHIHILLDGSYFPHKEISNTWQSVTKDSSVVWIKRFIQKKNAARYVTKYIAKPADFLKWPASKLSEFASAISGRRVLMVFGSSYRDFKDGHPQNIESGDDNQQQSSTKTYQEQTESGANNQRRYIATLYSIRDAVRRGTAWGRDWMRTANKSHPKLLDLVLRSIPDHIEIPTDPDPNSDRSLLSISLDCEEWYFNRVTPFHYIPIEPEPPTTLHLVY